MITAPDYDREALINCLCDLKQRYDLDIYLEPGTAIAFDAGILVGEVMDIMENDGPIAILDISATCHMPDVLEALTGQPCWQKQIQEPACLCGWAGQAVWLVMSSVITGLSICLSRSAACVLGSSALFHGENNNF